ncbi:hypothetical protein NEDG_00992 [Nematocida displodere]|uniref:Uncharacterized protein n=1 Tax=Nematocida displodere TaxID=1805483 RepID=A0A177EA93_9MICR|nr:hypothetical protein NEDG_00992 [Nematocida displodere]
MEAHKVCSEEHISTMLECLEFERYSDLLLCAWKTLYSVIIPFNSPDIHQTVSNYVVILRQLLSVSIATEEASHLLSVVDLIIHPRKGCIIEGAPDIEEKPAPVEEKHPEPRKRICMEIVE